MELHRKAPETIKEISEIARYRFDARTSGMRVLALIGTLCALGSLATFAAGIEQGFGYSLGISALLIALMYTGLYAYTHKQVGYYKELRRDVREEPYHARYAEDNL